MSVKPYVTPENLQTYAYQFDPEKDSQFFSDVAPRASRIFDKLCHVEPGYFAEKPTAAVERIFYGSGNTTIALPHYFGDPPLVALPSDYTTPSFVVRDGYLMIVDSAGNLVQNSWWLMNPYQSFSVWPINVPIKVTAKWGFESIPDDVIDAVCVLGIAMWRSKDTAFLKAIALEGQTIVQQSIPERVKLIAKGYRNNAMMPAFI